jgi:Pyruvate/2-oxoacid:ferredoxin oxidoreductase delta subunit
MTSGDIPIHYVCTHEKARELVDSHTRFWVSNCGCREARKVCGRSRMDVCLMFSGESAASGSGKKEIASDGAQAILAEARAKNLVARPFRDEGRTSTDGICFCCDDCYGYFLSPDEKCGKGELVAETDLDTCTHCGACTDLCYFKARSLDENGKLSVDADACYGCGLCRTACPEDCIQMVERS